jgi:hypothetical protein
VSTEIFPKRPRIVPRKGTTQLTGRLEVIFRPGRLCRDDPDLERFRVTTGPAAGECNDIINNLLTGKAKPQRVGFAYEHGNPDLLGLVSVRTNYEDLFDLEKPQWLRELARHPYIGLLARDDRYPGCVLCDGRTRLSAVLVRSAVEITTAAGETPPLMWAYCRKDNASSVRAFARSTFHPDLRQAEGADQYALKRFEGRALRAGPDPSVYAPARLHTQESLAA